jgi:hypothetical protein
MLPQLLMCLLVAVAAVGAEDEGGPIDSTWKTIDEGYEPLIELTEVVPRREADQVEAAYLLRLGRFRSPKICLEHLPNGLCDLFRVSVVVGDVDNEGLHDLFCFKPIFAAY